MRPSRLLAKATNLPDAFSQTEGFWAGLEMMTEPLFEAMFQSAMLLPSLDATIVVKRERYSEAPNSLVLLFGSVTVALNCFPANVSPGGTGTPTNSKVWPTVPTLAR